ncbi:MAG: hypothetical protein KatS3mg054_0113 [Chloroflexus sp.]|nr:MAG: hypothetical protein KatS3mg054_0113 [Chloroflexus sp.]
MESVATRFPLAVDERAVSALTEALKKIRFANGYYVDFVRVLRVRRPMPVASIRERSEIHVIAGHILGADDPREQIYARSAAGAFWMSVPVTILFYVRASENMTEIVYRLAKAEILRAILSSPIVDDGGIEYPLQVGPGPFEDVRYPIQAYPLFYEEKPEFAAGAIEIILLASFGPASPYEPEGSASPIFASR